ncbi:MAG: 4Fe-4S binding protein, partial [Oscillospiraceae bacterium]|nr:4Fe-4S binding protein [Oscillospiraceae bacterium]
SPEEAYTMVADAFACSERMGRPVILRPTTRVCHSYASVQLLDKLPAKTPEGYTKDNGRWVIFPRLAYANHIKIEAQLQELSKEFSRYAGNQLTGSGTKGIACGGVSTAYVKEALAQLHQDCKLLKIATVPFPAPLGEAFLRGLEEVLVVEELDPVIETSLGALRGTAKIKGKLTGDVHNAGENTVASVTKAIRKFLTGEDAAQTAPALPTLPVRPPVLCAGCPHRASFFAIKEAAKGRKAVYSGDIGCYTLGNAQPLDMVDTCLCMGAGIAQAQGLHRVEPDTLHFAFIGDSTFFHTGIPGIVNAVYNQTDIIVVILDNATTAMTGNQPHPGIGKTVAGQVVDKISIYEIVKAIGVAKLVRVNAFDLPEVIAAAKSMLDKPGVRVLLLEGPCIAIGKTKKPPLTIKQAACTGCRLCIKKLGCPAISLSDGKALIDSALCTGCGICTNVCPFRAIGGAAE